MGSLRGSMARGVEAMGMKLYLYLKEVLGWPVDLLKGLLSRLGYSLHLEVLGPRGWLSSKHGVLGRWGISRGSRSRLCSRIEDCSWRIDKARERPDVDQKRAGARHRAGDNSCGERKTFKLLLTRLRVNYWSGKMTLPSQFGGATQHVIGYCLCSTSLFKLQTLPEHPSIQFTCSNQSIFRAAPSINWRICGSDFMAWHDQSRGGGRLARHPVSSSIFYLSNKNKASMAARR